MNSTMTYDKLYDSMVRKFTVEKDNKEYTLGDYMLMKAQAKKNAMTLAKTNAMTAPVAHEQKTSAIAAVFSYVNEKLTVKEAPIRNKTMRSFPLRTSFTALCSALVVCALVVCCCFFGLSASVTGNDNTVITETEAENETENMEETASYSIDFEKI